MHSHRDAKLPVPAILLRLGRTLYAIWSKARETWDWSLIWLYAHYAAYRSTEEDRAQLLEWVRSKAPGSSVSDFSTTWRNGVALMALLEGLLPTACNSYTQYHLLNPKHSVQNIELGFSVAKKYIGLSPNLKATEMAAGDSSASERKLVCYITMIKLAMTLPKMRAILAQPANRCPKEDPVFRNQPCLAKGMGLVLAVKGRCARFNIYLKHSDFLDIVIEIRDPNGNFCSRRITLRSPHKTVSRMAPSPPPLSTTASSEQPQGCLSPSMSIPLQYEITGRKVSVAYVPVSTGKHNLSIFWHGQHLKGSPFTVTVDDSFDKFPEETVTKQAANQAASIHAIDTNLLRVRPTRMCPKLLSRPRKVGRILCRRIIRRVVLRNGEELELRDDEPLPPDVRTWCSSKNLSFDDPSDVDSTPSHQETKLATLHRSRTLIKEHSMDLGLNPTFTERKKSDVVSAASITEESEMNPDSTGTSLRNGRITCLKNIKSEGAASPCKSPVITAEEFLSQMQYKGHSNKELQNDAMEQLPNELKTKDLRLEDCHHKDEMVFTSNYASRTDCSSRHVGDLHVELQKKDYEQLPRENLAAMDTKLKDSHYKAEMGNTAAADTNYSAENYNPSTSSDVFPLICNIQKRKNTSKSEQSNSGYHEENLISCVTPSTDACSHTYNVSAEISEAERTMAQTSGNYNPIAELTCSSDALKLSNSLPLYNLSDNTKTLNTSAIITSPKLNQQAEMLLKMNALCNAHVNDLNELNTSHNLLYADGQNNLVEYVHGIEHELKDEDSIGCCKVNDDIIDKHCKQTSINNEIHSSDENSMHIKDSVDHMVKDALICCTEENCDVDNEIVHEFDGSLLAEIRGTINASDEILNNSNCADKFVVQLNDLATHERTQTLQDCSMNNSTLSDHFPSTRENYEHHENVEELLIFSEDVLHLEDKSIVLNNEESIRKIVMDSDQQQKTDCKLRQNRNNGINSNEQQTVAVYSIENSASTAVAAHLSLEFQTDFARVTANSYPNETIETPAILYDHSLNRTNLNRSLPESLLKCTGELGIFENEPLISQNSKCSLHLNCVHGITQQPRKDAAVMEICSDNEKIQSCKSYASVSSEDQPFNVVGQLDFNVTSEDEIEICRRERGADIDTDPVLNVCHSSSPQWWSGSDMSLISSQSSTSVPLHTPSLDSMNTAFWSHTSAPLMPLLDVEKDSISCDSSGSWVLEPAITATTTSQTSTEWDSPLCMSASSSLVLSPIYLSNLAEVVPGSSSDRSDVTTSPPEDDDVQQCLLSSDRALRCNQNNGLLGKQDYNTHTIKALEQEAFEESLRDHDHKTKPTYKSFVKAKIQEWEFCFVNGQKRERSSSCPASLPTTTIQNKLAQLHQNMSFCERQPVTCESNESTNLEELGQLKICATRISEFEKGQLRMSSAQLAKNEVPQQPLTAENLCRQMEMTPHSSGLLHSYETKPSTMKVQPDPYLPTEINESYENSSKLAEGNLRRNYLYKEMLNVSTNQGSHCTETLSSNDETTKLAIAKSCCKPPLEVLKRFLKSEFTTFKYLPVTAYKGNYICTCPKQQAKNTCTELLLSTDSRLQNVFKDGQYNVVLESKYHHVQYNPLYKCTDS